MDILKMTTADVRGTKKIMSKLTREEMASLQKQIYYSDKYTDDEYEYSYRQFYGLRLRQGKTLKEHDNHNNIHVMLPKELAKLVPKGHLMSETEWRSIAVQQSQGWIHYMRHDPEPHILLFRRKLTGN